MEEHFREFACKVLWKEINTVLIVVIIIIIIMIIQELLNGGAL